jgi:glycogen synthase
VKRAPRLLVLAPGEISRDPRARREVAAAASYGLEVEAIGGVAEGASNRSSRLSGLGGIRPTRPLIRELRGLYRLLRLVLLTVRLATRGRRAGRVDIVHANDFATLPAGWLLARAKHARLVYDAHELYTEQEPDPPRLHRLVATRAEGWIARRADSVVTVADTIADELHVRLRLATPPLVVLNCPPLTDLTSKPAHTRDLQAIYQGAVGPGRQLADLFEVASFLENVQVTIRVIGVDTEVLRSEVAHRGLEEQVRIAEAIAADELVAALEGFDVGLVINRPVTRNDELVLPNKLFEYLMAGMAVVAPRLTELHRLIERENVGLTFEPANPRSLADALLLLATDRDTLRLYRDNARRVAIERYNAEHQAETLAKAWRI